MRRAASSNPSFGCLGLVLAHDGMVAVTFVQSVIRPLDEYFGPLNQAGRQKGSEHADEYFLDKCRVHAGLRSSHDAIATRHQNPHCRVFMIQSPRSKFVSACAKTQESKLPVR
jgi:hypothetical protein